MTFQLRPLIVSVACLLTSGSALADVLYQQLPTDPAQNQWSDAATGSPYLQAIPALAGATLDKIVWWGFHGPLSMGESADVLEVLLNGTAVAGSLTKEADLTYAGLTRYTLDIADIALTATEIGVWNTSLDVEWIWSGAPGNDTAGNPATAFRLEGTRATSVPEPTTLALLGLAGAALLRTRRARA